jgi:hypothetical protein
MTDAAMVLASKGLAFDPRVLTYCRYWLQLPH